MCYKKQKIMLYQVIIAMMHYKTHKQFKKPCTALHCNARHKTYVLCLMSCAFFLLLMPYVLCLLACALCLISNVLCLMSYSNASVLCPMSYVSYIIQAWPLAQFVLLFFWMLAVLWESICLVYKMQLIPALFNPGVTFCLSPVTNGNSHSHRPSPC